MKISINTDPTLFAISKDVDTAAIVAIDQANQIISVTGDITGYLEKGSRINIVNSTGNNKLFIHVGYTVALVSFDATNTIIAVVEAIPDATADGNVEYYDGINKTTRTIIVEGDQTTKFASNDIVEIVDADNIAINGAYTIDTDILVNGRTEIVVDEDIPSVLGINNGAILIFEGSTVGMFMAKSIGTSVYNTYPQGKVSLGIRDAVVLSSADYTQRQDLGKDHDKSIVMAIPNDAEFVFKFSNLIDPVAGDIDAAIASIKAIVNP